MSALPHQPRNWQKHPATKAFVVLFLTALVLIMSLYADAFENWLLHAEAVRDWLHSHGAAQTATAFFVLNTLLCACGIPRLWTSALAGAIFGGLPGLLLSLPSALAGAALTYEFGRLASAAFLEDIIPAKWKGWLEIHAAPNALQVAVIRQLPVPGAILTLLLAAGGISRRAFLLGSAIGFLPGAAIAAFLGTAATTRQTPETLLLTCVIVAASLGALALLHRNNRIRP